MRVIVIDEENHGFIGIANNYYNAVKWLIKEHWLSRADEVYRDGKWENIDEAFGEDWETQMLEQWDMERFNRVFDGLFYLRSYDVFGTEDE